MTRYTYTKEEWEYIIDRLYASGYDNAKVKIQDQLEIGNLSMWFSDGWTPWFNAAIRQMKAGYEIKNTSSS
jgi:hypothetical protein